MDDDIIEIRNRNAYYYDYDDEWRNGGPRNRRVVVQGNRPSPWSSSPPPGAFPRPVATVAPVAYAQPVPAPVSRVLNMPPGALIDAAAQLLAAFSQPPQPPTINANGDANANAQNLTNLVEYQRALAAHQKRNEQIRTVGTLAKTLMVL